MEEFWKSDRFREWWETYNWDALTDVDSGTDEPQSLQDYWRSEEDSLIEFGGKKWTRLHLPKYDLEGTACPVFNEAKNDKFWVLIKAKLAAASVPKAVGTADQSKIAARRDRESHPATLHGVVFPRWETSSDDGWIYADWTDAIFTTTAWFDTSKLYRADFRRTRFLSLATFTECEFVGTTDFSDVVCEGSFFFDNVRQDGALWMSEFVLHGAGYFEKTHFADEAWFGSCRFRQNVNFTAADFRGSVDFNDTVFTNDAWFDESKFGADASFRDVHFHGLATFLAPRAEQFAFSNRVNFSRAVFKGDAYFNGRVFRGSTMFSGCRFHGLPLFHGAELHPETVFERECFLRCKSDIRTVRSWQRAEEVRLGREEQLAKGEGARAKLKIKFWRDRFKQKRSSWKLSYQVAVYRLRLPFRLRWPLMTPLRKHMDAQTRRCELAFRTLRKQFAEHQNVEDEMMFYGLELDARRARTDVPVLFERLLAWLYKKTSNDGRDMLRPVLWAIAIWAASAGLLYGETRGMAHPPAAGKIGEYALRKFIPFLPTLQDQGASWLSANDIPDVVGSTLGVMNVLLPVIAIGLVTVFLIALRRRFQIER